MTDAPYGQGDASYQAAGGWEGICALVNAFYDVMDSAPMAGDIRAMHAADLSEARDKLSCFLSGWLGGPKRYAERYGRGLGIPAVHQHMKIGAAERDAWLWCMQQAIDQQPYPVAFKEYLYRQLCVPAERIVQRCALHAEP